jgi:hypothetical protein
LASCTDAGYGASGRVRHVDRDHQQSALRQRAIHRLFRRAVLGIPRAAVQIRGPREMVQGRSDDSTRAFSMRPAAFFRMSTSLTLISNFAPGS